MHIRNTLLAIVILAFAILTALPAQAGVRAGKKRALLSTVQVVVTTRFDTTRRTTGLVFSHNGHILTNFHAVSDAVDIKVMHPGIGVFEVDRIKRIDPRANVAVLSLEHYGDANVETARIADSRLVKEGDPVHVLHHPAYSDEVLYDTTVKSLGYSRQYPGSYAMEGFASEMMLFELEGPFDVGSAGGIVCNEDWEVVGLIVGGGGGSGDSRTAYALASGYFQSMLVSSYDVEWANLRTGHDGDAAYFDQFFGPAPQLMGYQSPMPEGYIAWFAPTYHSAYSDYEFTYEINDKVDKNWFFSDDLEIDGRPIEEWSASRIFIWPAYVNPWDVTDTVDQYVHFDADSLFSKRIYVDRDTEERIMARYILCMALEPGKHTLRYINRGANYKSTGRKSERVDIVAATIKLLDIQGLSFVSMLLLPNSIPSAGEGEPVRYELERRPMSDLEINGCVRKVRYDLGIE